MEKTYLGDGVYVDFEAGEIILTTENGILITNRIVMDPAVMIAFLKYLTSNPLLNKLIPGRS